jgi:hypothetical protein
MIAGHVPEPDPSDPGSQRIRGLDADRDRIVKGDDNVPSFRERVWLKKGKSENLKKCE